MDPLSAFAAIKTAHSTITQAIKIGQDFSQLASPILKWANAEANIENYAAKRGSLVGKVFGKLSVTEQSAIEAHLRKEEVKRMRDEMRQIFLLYGSPGQWERLQATIAQARAIRKKELEEQARQRDLIINCTVGVVLASIGIAIIVWWAKYLKG